MPSLPDYSTDALDTDHVLTLFEQIVSAVRDAHENGVVHRDIKPNNVVISTDDAKIYLIDFGICQYSDGGLTHLTTDEAFGNPAFAAPECFRGREEEPGPPCDVYSLGKLLYWMVSQRRCISRERLSSTVSGRIAEGNDLIRFYLMRLLRATVVEDPVRRWPASQLLEEVCVPEDSSIELGSMSAVAKTTGSELRKLSTTPPLGRPQQGIPVTRPIVR